MTHEMIFISEETFMRDWMRDEEEYAWGFLNTADETPEEFGPACLSLDLGLPATELEPGSKQQQIENIIEKYSGK